MDKNQGGGVGSEEIKSPETIDWKGETLSAGMVSKILQNKY